MLIARNCRLANLFPVLHNLQFRRASCYTGGMDEVRKEVASPPLGWRLNEQGALVRETVHRMTRRLVGWNYHDPCIYQITVVLADRRSRALGRLRVADGAGGWVDVEAAKGLKLAPEAVRAVVEPTALGAAVAACWEACAQHYPQVKVIDARVMPDHVHGILWVQRPLACHLGQVIKGFKTGCNKAARALGVPFSATVSPSTARPPTRTHPATVSPSTPRPRGGLFAEGFQDTILFRRGQLAAMRRYLADNPRRLAVKRLFPDLFRRVAALRVPMPGLGPSAIGWFSALGNRFLLQRPIVQVQVSRRFFAYRRVPCGSGVKILRDAAGVPAVAASTPEFDAIRDGFLAAARHGAVLLSPCISDGEREIARQAFTLKLPVIAMRNKGFARLQKPVGRAFDACADGRLLMLAPAAWPHLPGEKRMTRADATAMNRLCQWIAGEGASEIDYHGLRPCDIDSPARIAARVSSAVPR